MMKTHIIPEFGSNWTNQMSRWLDQVTAGMGKGEIYDFLRDHWDEICESWSDKDKWYRIIGCLDGISKLQELGEGERQFIINDLNTRAHYWSRT